MDLRLPNPPLHESLANIPEDRLVEQLVRDPLSREALFNTRGMPDHPRIRLRVPLDDAPGGFRGDVDILLCATPEAATAIEVKRIKVGQSAFETGTPNKLHEYTLGVAQANRLAAAGFSQVYLYVFVVVDSRVHNEGRLTFDGLTPELDAVIDSTVSRRGLDARVGLLLHEFVQPMDHPPLTTGSGGCSLKDLAAYVPQSPALTQWVTRHFPDDAA